MPYLTNVRKLGRYTNPNTGSDVNVHKGRVAGRSTDVLFWLKSGVRQFVSDREFYGDWKTVTTRPTGDFDDQG